MNKSVLLHPSFANYIEFWDGSTNQDILGGTESMFLGLAKNLAKMGYDVTLVCQPPKNYTGEDGVTYLSVHNPSLSKCFDVGVFYFLEDAEYFSGVCQKMFLAPSCEPLELRSGTNLTNKDINRLDIIEKIICLSEFHRKHIKREYGISDDKLVLIPNAFDWYEYYENYGTFNKEMSMVWSSRYERNFEFFMDMVYPIIKKNYPDFKVFFANYVDNSNETVAKKYPNDVTVLGHLSKKELSEYQKKSMIWVYPNVGINFSDKGNFFFHETFCYTALENALAGNAIICFGDGKDGIATTLKNGNLLPGKVFDENAWFFEEDKLAIANLMAAEAVRCLTYLTERKKRCFSKADSIWYEYRWERIINCWINIFEDE